MTTTTPTTTPETKPKVAQSQGNPTRRLLSLSQPRWGRLAITILLSACAFASSVGLLATSAFLISKAALQPPILHLQVAIVGVRAFGISRAVFRYLERIVGHDAALRSLGSLRGNTFERIRQTTPGQRWGNGDLLSRFVADMDESMNLQLRALVPFFGSIVVSLGTVLLIWFFLPLAALSLAVALLVGTLLVPMLTLKITSRYEAQVAPLRAKLSDELVRVADHRIELQLLDMAKTQNDRIKAIDKQLTDLGRASARWRGIATGLNNLIQGLAVVFAVIIAVPAVTSGELTGTLLAVIILVPLAAYESVANLPSAATTWLQARASAKRVVEIVDQPVAVSSPVHSAHFTEVGNHDLRVVNYQARWSKAEGSPQLPAEPLNLQLLPGQMVALVGASGSGKSTALAGLVGLAPARGEVRYGGQDLTRLSWDDRRRIIRLGLQNPYLFDTSIVENLRIANRSVTDAELRSALAKVNLTGWIDSLPGGWDSPVGRLGHKVSQGQRQRLGIVRMLISTEPVVLIDEPTEHLGPGDSQAVLDSLRELAANKCILLTTHLPSDIAACDQVVRIG